jgi:tRNA (cmo5U34)-methyltransferase
MHLNVGKTWTFDHTVADHFENHARQHIPNYDLVIKKSVELCDNFLTPDSAIIDVGCATGHTVQTLHQAGYRNLHGVDASASMLAKCDHSIATYHHSDHFPSGMYDAVLCNWTLHFIDNKIQYLADIYHGLNNNGFTVISDKVSEDPVLIELYHAWKKAQGCSDEEIAAKAQSLTGVMKVQSTAWWLQALHNLGFSQVTVIDAHWCFATFLAQK